MAERFSELAEDHIEFIRAQHIFFVATALAEGHVNLSPKGMDAFRVVAPDRVRWLNVTGSGNETAAHVLRDGRMTVMFCSFEKKPLILRLYGTASVVQEGDDRWDELSAEYPPQTGARQVFELDVTLVQTSCGYGIPYLDYVGERDTLSNWAHVRGRDGIRDYWRERNAISLDGLPTGVPGSEAGA